jgi:hypothetical protein
VDADLIPSTDNHHGLFSVASSKTREGPPSVYPIPR